MVQFGPSDYAMSLGWNTAEHLSEVNDAHCRMIEAALKHGVRPRVELYGPADDAHKWIAMGVKDFCFGDESMVYTRFVNTAGKEIRQIVNGIK